MLASVSTQSGSINVNLRERRHQQVRNVDQRKSLGSALLPLRRPPPTHKHQADNEKDKTKRNKPRGTKECGQPPTRMPYLLLQVLFALLFLLSAVELLDLGQSRSTKVETGISLKNNIKLVDNVFRRHFSLRSNKQETETKTKNVKLAPLTSWNHPSETKSSISFLIHVNGVRKVGLPIAWDDDTVEEKSNGNDDEVDDEKRNSERFYGDLEIEFSGKPKRTVKVKMEDQEKAAPFFSQKESKVEDDDFNPAIPHDNGDNECRRARIEQNNHRPVCNAIQELGFEEMIRTGTNSFLGHGDMNNVFKIDLTDSYQEEKYIFKGFLPFSRRRRVVDERRWNEMRREATVNAATSFHPRIVSSYGFCGFTVLGELMGQGDLRKLIKDDPFCKGPQKRALDPLKAENKPLVDASQLTPAQKLRLSLDVAEAVAVLHNHPEGSIVHGDLWMGQFLLENDTENLRARLNDFNYAAFLNFNPRTQQYCPFDFENAWVDFEAAFEDVTPAPSGCERDVYRVGNIMFSILTGFLDYPQACRDREKLKLLKNDERSFLDPRWENKSVAEGEIVRLIRKCWETKPRDRPEIAEVVQTLQKALDTHLAELESEKI